MEFFSWTMVWLQLLRWGNKILLFFNLLVFLFNGVGVLFLFSWFYVFLVLFGCPLWGNWCWENISGCWRVWIFLFATLDLILNISIFWLFWDSLWLLGWEKAMRLLAWLGCYKLKLGGWFSAYVLFLGVGIWWHAYDWSFMDMDMIYLVYVCWNRWNSWNFFACDINEKVIMETGIAISCCNCDSCGQWWMYFLCCCIVYQRWSSLKKKWKEG